MKERFVVRPNLPEEKVTTVAFGSIYADLLQKPLDHFGIVSVLTPGNPDISNQISFHIDMSIFHCGGNKLIAAKSVYHDIVGLKKLGFQIIQAKTDQAAEYPKDCSLNACMAGSFFIHNFRLTEPEILTNLPEGTIKLGVNQGYTKCSICILDDHHMITADKAIADTLRSSGVNVLFIKPGFIDLTAYNTGFIGGCCVKLSKSVIAFTGHFKKHPDKDEILNYIKNAGIEIEYLSDRSVFDVGSILPLKERVSSF